MVVHSQETLKILLVSPSRALFQTLSLAMKQQHFPCQMAVEASDFGYIHNVGSYSITFIDIDRMDRYGPQIVSEVVASVETDNVVVATDCIFPGFSEQLFRAGATRVFCRGQIAKSFISCISEGRSHLDRRPVSRVQAGGDH